MKLEMDTHGRGWVYEEEMSELEAEAKKNKVIFLTASK
jgi:hypothetical protein